MRRAIFWKDLRETRLPALVLLILGLGILYGVVPLAEIRDGITLMRVGLAASFAWAVGMVTGAILLANERESFTLTFLDIQPRWRSEIFRAKLWPALAIITVATAIFTAACLHLGADHLDAYTVFGGFFIGFAAFLGLSCGLFGSALGHSVLAAIGWAVVGLLVIFQIAYAGLAILGIALAAPVSLITDDPTRSEEFSIVLFGGAAILASMVPMVLGFIAFTKPDRSRRRAVSYVDTAGTPSTRVGLGWRTTTWLSWRQGRYFHLLLLPAAFLTGPLIVVDPLAVWPISSLIIGVLAGTALMADEQMWQSFRFLAEQRLPLGRFWAWKVTQRLGFALIALAAHLVAGYLTMALIGEIMEPAAFSKFRDQRVGFQTQALVQGSGLIFASIWFCYGFGFGHLCGLAVQKSFVAVALALPIAAMTVSIWIPSMVSGGLPWWQTMLVPVGAIVLARLLVWSWATGRLYSRRAWALWVGFSVLGLVSCAGFIAWRVVAIPKPRLGFDVDQFVADVPPMERDVNRGVINRGLNEMMAQVKAPFSTPYSTEGLQAIFVSKTGISRNAAQVFDNVKRAGWREHSNLDQLVDESCRGGWIDALRPLSDQPLAMLTDLSAPAWYRSSDTHTRLGIAGNMIMVRALQLQSRGEHAQALDLLLLGFRLSRHTLNLANLVQYYTGLAIERNACQALERWSEHPGVSRALLERATAGLIAHEQARPLVSDMIKAELVRAREALKNPNALVYPTAPTSSDQWKSTLNMVPAVIPWEKERRQRLVDNYFANYLEAVSTDFPTMREWKRSEARSPQTPFGSLYPVGGQATAEERRAIADKFEKDWFLRFTMHSPMNIQSMFSPLATLRAVRLKLALLVYQHGHGKPAERLEDLVTSKILASLPVDPFSGREFRYRISTGEELTWVATPEDEGGPDWEFHRDPMGFGPGVGGAAAAGLSPPDAVGPMGGGAGPGQPLPHHGPMLEPGIGIILGGVLAHEHLGGVAAGSFRKRLQPGQAVLWSVGADGIDHGGTRQYGAVTARTWADQFDTGETDILTVIPILKRK